jgi:uncharacterized membrane protein HdeD (DUF308 family)
VSVQPTRPDERSPYWGVPVARAIPALIVAAAITFTLNHSSSFGLLVFGLFALTTGLLLGALSFRALPAGPVRTVFVVHSIVSVIAGVLGIALNTFGSGFLVFLVSVWAAITGFLELYSGIRSRGAAESRDWVVVGAFTALLAIVYLVFPLNDVEAVGFFGIYAVILAVYLLIGGLSLRWGTTPTAQQQDAVAGQVPNS